MLFVYCVTLVFYGTVLLKQKDKHNKITMHAMH